MWSFVDFLVDEARRGECAECLLFCGVPLVLWRCGRLRVLRVLSAFYVRLSIGEMAAMRLFPHFCENGLPQRMI